MAVRKRLSHPDIVRQRIQTSQLVNRLTDHAFGNCEMTPTQVSAALGILRKSLPDLSAVAHSGHIDTKPEELNDAELADIAKRGSDRAVEAQSGEEEPSSVH